MGFNQKINDSMNNMSRSVTTQMMKDAPPDLTYVYIGAIDEKTRPFCLEAAAQGALTEEQILGLGGEYAESLVSGGGINCRHNWELASDDIQSQFHRGGEAQKIIEAKPPVNILSPKMAGKHKTVVDAKFWAENNISRKVRFDKNDISVDDLNEINKSIMKTIKDNGLPLLDEIGWQNEVYKTTQNTAFLLRHVFDDKDTIYKMGFNKTAIKSWKKRRDISYRTYGEANRWGIGHGSLESVVRHEVGHYAYYRKANVRKKWVKEMDNLRATTPSREVYEMTRKVSQYSLESKSELFAEIHSGVMIGKEASIPKPLLEMYYRALGG